MGCAALLDRSLFLLRVGFHGGGAAHGGLGFVELVLLDQCLGDVFEFGEVVGGEGGVFLEEGGDG